MDRKIPTAVIAVVADAFAAKYTHAQIDGFMMAAGIDIPNTPVGNKEVKTRASLKHANETLRDPLAALGQVIIEVMEVKLGFSGEEGDDPHKAKIHRILQRYSLAYMTGGYIVPAGTSALTQNVDDFIQTQSLSGLQVEFERILNNVESDPAAAVTASCAMLESLFKTFIAEEHLEMPADQTIKPLWKVIRKELRFDPDLVEDADLKTILGGLTAIVEGLGSLRTHKGSAHGHHKKSYKLQPRHARLAANGAFTLAGFILESWDKRKQSDEFDRRIR
jgi:hypothetical protein